MWPAPPTVRHAEAERLLRRHNVVLLGFFDSGRPKRTPLAFTLASPAFVQSLILMRSYSAIAPRIPMIASLKTPSKSMYCSV